MTVSAPETKLAASNADLPTDQQWQWVGRDRRASVRLTAGMWTEIERRAVELNLPWSAVLRFVVSQGLKSAGEPDDS